METIEELRARCEELEMMCGIQKRTIEHLNTIISSIAQSTVKIDGSVVFDDETYSHVIKLKNGVLLFN